MKKVIALLLVFVLVLGLVACGAKKEAAEAAPEAKKTVAEIEDNAPSADGKYEVAFVTDIGQLKDHSFNEGTWNGVKLYAYENGKTYKYYQPANGSDATDDDRYDAMAAACDNGAKVVVCAGYLQEAALTKAATNYPDVKFIFIDGYPIGCDNVAPVAFKEQECGYFAGYAAVMEGYTKLGFTGGGGGTNPACCRYGYGFVQGANAAAAEKNVNVEVNYSWLYGASFSASTELQTMVSGWYENGTEVIFCCGGSMYNSVFSAASENDAFTIGVDSDQSFDSDTVITSALKGVGEAAAWAIGKVYDGTFGEIAGVPVSLGAADGATALPTATWSLKNWGVADYEALLAKAISGEVAIDDNYENLTQDYSNLTLNIVE